MAVVLLLALIPIRVAYVNARHAIERGHCQGFMKYVVVTCRLYSEENDGRWPSLSSTPGRLMFDVDSVYPEHVQHTVIFVCPEQENFSDLTEDEGNSENIDDLSFAYLGYAFTNQDELTALLGVVETRWEKGLAFDSDIETDDGVVFRRLHDSLMTSDEIDPSVVPVLIENSGTRHPIGALNVTYLDGHSDLLRLGSKFPATEEALAALRRVSRN